MTAGEALTISPTGDGLSVAGEIDAHTAPQLAVALAAGSGSELTVDMSGVDFVDSSGLRVIIEAHQASERDGGRLVLRNPSPAVVRLLQISGVSDYLHVSSADSNG